MTTNKNRSHLHCTHPSTKSARAKCRAAGVKAVAEVETVTPEEIEFALTAKARSLWEAEFPRFCSAHQSSAHQNADDTACEEGFEEYSRRWYEVAVSTLHHARDTADRVMNALDPEPGQMLTVYWSTDYLWVERVKWDEGVAAEVTVKDQDGNYSVIKPADIIEY